MFKKPHEWLCQKQKWYRKWHQFSWHPAAHMGLLVVAIGLIAAQAFSPSAPSVQAASLTVCPSGCNYTSIFTAAEAASEGDTISVTSGTYNGGLRLSQLTDNDKNFILDGNNAAILKYTGGDDGEEILEFGYQNATTILRNFNVVCEVGGATIGVAVYQTASPTITGNTVTGCEGSAVEIDSSGTMTVSNNTLRNSMIGVSARGGGTVRMDSNIISGNSEAGITVQNGTYQIVNNILYDNGNTASIVVQDLVQTGSNVTAVIVNNTLDSNYPLSITDVESSGGTITVYHKNNISVNAPTDIIINDLMGNPISLFSDYNFYDDFVGEEVGVGTFTGLSQWRTQQSQDANSFKGESAAFTDIAGNDYRLQNSSPAIGLGTDDIVGTNDLATYSATLDFLNNARPAVIGSVTTRPDIGAYENQTMGDPTTLIVSVPSALDTATPQGQATATAEYSAGPNQDVTALATWNSSDVSIAYVTDAGVVYGQSTGSAGVSAFFSSLASNTASVTTSGLPDYVSIYIDADNGNDTTGDGSETAPLKTIAAAEPYFLPGARIFLKGSFQGDIEIGGSLSGTADQNTWLTNWPGESATIDADGGQYGVYINGASYVTIEGLTITGATNPEQGSGIVITRGSSDITINNNTIYSNGFGIFDLGSQGTNSNITISNNTIHDNNSGNIMLFGSDTVSMFNNILYNASMGIAFMGASDGVQAWNNTLVNHGGVGIAAYDINGDGDPTVINTVFKNNLIFQAGPDAGAAFNMTSAVKTGTGNSFDYNLYFSEDGPPLITVDNTNYITLAAWQAASTHDDNSVSGDPLFINPDEDDYTIDESSPAYGIGISTGAPAGTATDITGDVNRLGDYDIGAYGVDLRPTAATNLVATGLTSSAFTLSWTDNASGLRQETSTAVKYSTTSASTGFNTIVSTLSPDVATLAVTGLTADTQYWFRVDGINSFGTTNSAALAVHTQAAGSGTPSPTTPTPPVVTPPTCSETRLATFSSFTAIKNFVDVVKKNKVRATLQDYLEYLDFNCDGDFDLKDFVEFIKR